MRKTRLFLVVLFFAFALLGCASKEYTISFESNGGSAVSSMTAQKGDELTKPDNPTKVGYTFEGWYTDASLTSAYTFTTMPAQNLTLYANYTINQYTISFESNGGSDVTAITQDYNTTVVPPNDPLKDGYAFEGWYTDTSLTTTYTFTTMPAQDLTLYAKYDIDQFTISFESNGGTDVTAITQDYNTTVSSPSNPTKTGFTFDGWCSDALLTTAYTFTTMPGQDITLYAKYTINQYTISFESNGGSAVTAITQDYNTPVTAPDTPNKEGYTFEGWYTDALLTTLYTFISMPAQDLMLYANYTINQYTISFESNGGSAVTAITQDYNSSVVAPDTPNKEGYTFEGWYADAALTTAYTFTTMPLQDLTLYANYTINQYTISFESNGGSDVTAITQDYNTSLTAPADPTKTGYTFEGWYTDVLLTTPYTFTTMPAQDLTLYANYTANSYVLSYTVSDDSTSSIMVPLLTGESIGTYYIKQQNGAIITSENRLLVWGYNFFNNVDLTSKSTVFLAYDITPQLMLQLGETILQVSIGFGNYAILTSNHRVIVWGNGSNYGLGNGLNTSIITPTDITGNFSLNSGEFITNIQMGNTLGAALTSAGRMFTWGNGSYGELGNGTTTYVALPVDITPFFNLNASDFISSIYVGDDNLAAISSTGAFYLWGNNNHHQVNSSSDLKVSTPYLMNTDLNLNLSEQIDKVIFFFSSTMILTSEGRILGWGQNSNGELGTLDNLEQTTPVDVTANFVSVGETIIDISANFHTLHVLTSNQRVIGVGSNSNGEIGNNSTASSLTPIDITSNFALNPGETFTVIQSGNYFDNAITSDGRIFVWGGNWLGQTGVGNVPSPLKLPVELTTGVIENQISYDYASVIQVYTPVKAGFVFSGWFTDPYFTTPLDSPAVMPNTQLTLYGYWIPEI